jgi:hypothetical protein
MFAGISGRAFFERCVFDREIVLLFDARQIAFDLGERFVAALQVADALVEDGQRRFLRVAQGGEIARWRGTS